jgi:hypothetical protein
MLREARRNILILDMDAITISEEALEKAINEYIEQEICFARPFRKDLGVVETTRQCVNN